jgi:uncharacterized Zn-binding protein involved in type VI secretion
MSAVSRVGDSIKGMTSGEHTGHPSPCPPSEITGTIKSSLCSSVFVNGIAVAVKGSQTEEHDSCCGTSYGIIAAGSSSVFAGGKAVSRVGDALAPHNGTASITSGSSSVYSN